MKTKRSREPEPGPFAGLRFAVYARKSDADARHEDHKSTSRQIEHATRYVEARGGTVLAEPFVDEDVSGAEFRNRPGLLGLLNVVENGRGFDALVMSDRDRLGREQFRRNMVLQEIRDAGVRIFAYLDDEEVRLDTATEKLMESVKGYAAEMERERARLRCRDASERKARQKAVAGGACFGYTNVRMVGDRPAQPGEAHDYVVRKIREDQAETIRAMFRMYDEGFGTVAAARTLNADPRYLAESRKYFGGKRVPPPYPSKAGWNAMTVRAMLSREAYRGVIVWGKMTHVDKGGHAGVCVKQDPLKLVRIPADHLRIVDEDLWLAVQDRLAVVREHYLRDSRGKLWGKPDLRREGRYLLSGLAKCGVCGGNITCLGRSPRTYGCSRHETGACSNTTKVTVRAAEDAFLAAIEREALTPERFAYAVEVAVKHVQAQLTKEPDRGAALERERVALSKKIERMVAAIGDGQGPASLVAEIRKAEGRAEEIEAERARLASPSALGTLDRGRIEEAVAGQLRRFSDLLHGNPTRGRQALKKLLKGRVEFKPVTLRGKRKTYAFAGSLSYGAILREVVSSPTPDGKYMERNPLGSSWGF